MKLTNAQFAQQCAYIAKNASNWAAELLDYAENRGSEANPEAVFRFTDSIRGRLDRLDRLDGRAALAQGGGE